MASVMISVLLRPAPAGSRWTPIETQLVPSIRSSIHSSQLSWRVKRHSFQPNWLIRITAALSVKPIGSACGMGARLWRLGPEPRPETRGPIPDTRDAVKPGGSGGRLAPGVWGLADGAAGNAECGVRSAEHPRPQTQEPSPKSSRKNRHPVRTRGPAPWLLL